jgi:elongation factor Ts
MEITAALVKELRERTSAGMMECKKALKECGGDIEAAIELMRKTGLAQAAKKAGRVAAEGLITIQQNNQYVAMVEVNCETDFVSRGDDFKGFCHALVKLILESRPADLDALLKLPFASSAARTVEETRQDLIAKIGENIHVRRFTTLVLPENGQLGVYLHGIRIGVLVEMRGGTVELAKDVAMHIAASRPVCVSPDQVAPELIAKEKEIYTAQASESGKAANIVEKMVNGRVQKFLNEVTLLGQPFVKNPDITVKKLLEEHHATVVRFERFEVGEGIEKKTTNFADEVRCQVQGH